MSASLTVYADTAIHGRARFTAHYVGVGQAKSQEENQDFIA